MNFGGYAELTITPQKGEAGLGFFRLSFQVDATTQHHERFRLSEVAGDLFLRRSGGETPVGFVRPVVPSFGDMGMGTKARETVAFVVDIDRARVDAIEELRNGGKLTFRLYLRGAVELMDGQRKVVNGQEDIPLEQSEWVQMLEDMGYRRSLVFDIPMPHAKNGSPLEKVVGYLQEAQEALLGGRHRHAIFCSGNALEALRGAVGGFEVEGKKRELLKSDRLKNVAQALTDLCHPARHGDKVAQEIVWERHDARSIVAAVAALIHVSATEMGLD